MNFRHLPSAVAAVLVAGLLYFLFQGCFGRFDRFDRLEDSLRKWKPDPSQLIGTWRIVEDRGWEIGYGNKKTWHYEFPIAKSGNYYWTWTFTADGTCIEIPYQDEQVGKRFRYDWSLKGNRFLLKDGDSEYADGIVVELNDTLFVFFKDYEEEECVGSWTKVYIRVE